MFILIRACDPQGLFSVKLFKVQKTIFDRFWSENDTFYFTCKPERHYVLTQLDVSNKYIHIDFPLDEFKRKTSILNGRIVQNYTWGSLINYKKRGFVTMMLYDTESDVEFSNVMVEKDSNRFSRLFENWSTDADEEEAKKTDSDSET